MTKQPPRYDAWIRAAFFQGPMNTPHVVCPWPACGSESVRLVDGEVQRCSEVLGILLGTDTDIERRPEAQAVPGAVLGLVCANGHSFSLGYFADRDRTYVSGVFDRGGT